LIVVQQSCTANSRTDSPTLRADDVLHAPAQGTLQDLSMLLRP